MPKNQLRNFQGTHYIYVEAKDQIVQISTDRVQHVNDVLRHVFKEENLDWEDLEHSEIEWLPVESATGDHKPTDILEDIIANTSDVSQSETV